MLTVAGTWLVAGGGGFVECSSFIVGLVGMR